MKTSTLESSHGSGQEIRLTRSRPDTVIWLARVSLALLHRHRAAKPASRTRGPIVLFRTREDTMRWAIRGTRWGMLAMVAVFALGALLLVGLWMSVPFIDAVTVAVRDSLASAFEWALDALAEFPHWLAKIS